MCLISDYSTCEKRAKFDGFSKKCQKIFISDTIIWSSMFCKAKNRRAINPADENEHIKTLEKCYTE